MKAIVSGGAGFIGSHIAERLLEEGYSVSIIDNLSTGDKNNIKDIKTYVEGRALLVIQLDSLLLKLT